MVLAILCLELEGEAKLNNIFSSMSVHLNRSTSADCVLSLTSQISLMRIRLVIDVSFIICYYFVDLGLLILNLT